jgi:hypothetical protein
MIVILKDGFVPLESLKDIIDISKVQWYSVEEKDGSFYLKLYNKQKRLIKPYAKEKASKSKKSKKVQK